MAQAESSSAPLKRQLSLDAEDFEDDSSGPSARSLEIKRRLVRAKKLRRPESAGSDNEERDGRAGGGEVRKERRSASPQRGGSGNESVSPSRRPRSRSHSPRSPRQPPEGSQTTSPPPATPPAPPASGPLTRSSFAPSRGAHPALTGCRSVYRYTRLNHIEEGTYGVVFRARCNDTGGIYALKKLKLDEERHGFPITSLREIMALMAAGEHENVVGIREIVVGDTLNQIFIVMPFIEHDLKTLLADMPHAFTQSEVKTIMRQLLSAVAHCHSHWILHRDLKTSNLLMNNRGQIKVADFGLARKFGDPLGEMTQLVVTLWYRAPELLLGAREYSTAIDLWSVGCIFAELIQTEPLFPGRGEIDQIGRIFNLLGRPNDDVWPGFSRLPNARSINAVGPTFSTLRQKFKHLTSQGHALMSALLCYDPERRISAAEAVDHPYFSEQPLPKHPDQFASFPSVASGERRHKLLASPPAPAPAHDAHGGSDKLDLESFV